MDGLLLLLAPFRLLWVAYFPCLFPRDETPKFTVKYALTGKGSTIVGGRINVRGCVENVSGVEVVRAAHTVILTLPVLAGLVVVGASATRASGVDRARVILGLRGDVKRLADRLERHLDRCPPADPSAAEASASPRGAPQPPPQQASPPGKRRGKGR